MKPLFNRVLIKPDPAPKQTQGGIQLPDSAEQIRNTGEVVQVGPGKYTEAGERIPVDVEVGDRVQFEAARAPSVRLAGETHVMVYDNQILGTFEEGDEDTPENEESELSIIT